MKITIPPIYEENIVEFSQRKGDCIFEYFAEGRLFRIIFNKVYAFDFVEFDYIQEIDWQFGLDLQDNSTYIQQMIKGKPKETIQNVFGGEKENIQHYKLVIDDVGIYNIVCKSVTRGYV